MRQPNSILTTTKTQGVAWARILCDTEVIYTICSMDTLCQQERSKRMSLVRGRDTKPEMRVRRMANALGYRYRLHRRDLPGKPDLVFGPRRKVIFVHGCFWHRHPDPACKLARLPKSRQDFWLPKLEGNRERDERNNAMLTEMGWDVLEVWECEIAEANALAKKIKGFLG